MEKFLLPGKHYLFLACAFISHPVTTTSSCSKHSEFHMVKQPFLPTVTLFELLCAATTFEIFLVLLLSLSYYFVNGYLITQIDFCGKEALFRVVATPKLCGFFLGYPNSPLPIPYMVYTFNKTTLGKRGHVL